MADLISTSGDINLVVLNGKLAAQPELRKFDTGNRLLRLLVTTRTENPHRRVDVVPVTLWEDDDNQLMFKHTCETPVGASIYVVGAIQRRFWSSESTRRSRLEVIAQSVETKDET
jgi:single-stranded DNA-binding protein